MQDVQPSLVEDEGFLRQVALDDIPQTSFQEAIEALKAAPPIEKARQPVVFKLTRQSARRMAIQITWKRLSEPQVDGRKIPRYIRRRMMFNKAERLFNFSDLARGLRSLTDTES